MNQLILLYNKKEKLNLFKTNDIKIRAWPCWKVSHVITGSRQASHRVKDC